MYTYTTTNTLLNPFQQRQYKVITSGNKAKRSVGYYELTTLCACTLKGVRELLKYRYTSNCCGLMLGVSRAED